MRVYKKKTDRQTLTEEVLMEAVNMVLNNRNEKGISIRKVAKKYKMSNTSLSRYIKRYEESRNEEIETSENEEDVKVELRLKRAGQVFNSENESIVIRYSHQYARIMGGLRPKQIRYLAYQCARKYNLKYPPSWDKNKCTGEDWLTKFLKRKKNEFTFLPPPRPLPKGLTVNKKDVETFYENLKELYDLHEFKGNDIYTMDQTNASTIVTDESGETTEAITIVTAANAIGNSTPPMLVFEDDKFKDDSTIDGPVDCIGASSKNGLMTDETFRLFLRHFVRCAKPDVTRPVLLLLANHKINRVDVTILDICRQEGIIMLSVPAGCETRLQPLNVFAFDAFKNMYSIYTREWLKNNPGVGMKIEHLPRIVRESWIRGVSAINVTKGFAKLGIYPLKPERYNDKNYPSFDGTHFLVCRDELPSTPITPPIQVANSTASTVPMMNDTHDNPTQNNSVPSNPIGGINVYGEPSPGVVPITTDYSSNVTSTVWDRNDYYGWSSVQGI